MMAVLSTVYPYQNGPNCTIVARIIYILVMGNPIDIIAKALVDLSNEGTNSREKIQKKGTKKRVR